MSKKSMYKIQCPHCDHESVCEIWDSLNVTVDPDDKQLLFDAKINQFECENCGGLIVVNAPFAYHDMDQKFYVQYFPESFLDDPESFKDYSPDGSYVPEIRQANSIPEYMKHPHIVFNMNELVRYVYFRDMIAD